MALPLAEGFWVAAISGAINAAVAPTKAAMSRRLFENILHNDVMHSLHELFAQLSNLQGLIQTGGYVAMTLIVFAETGLFVGFFLPGDSLLVTAGLVCSLPNGMNIWLLNIFLVTAAILGDSTGYWIGRQLGPRLFKKEDSLFFKKAHLLKTQTFYEKYGAKTILLARFVPIVRTFAPTVAGIGQMNYKRFITYNIVGGAGWVLSMTLLGYFLGHAIPNIGKNIHYVALVIIVLSFVPILHEWRAARRASPKPNQG
jgi:membrane-associated protein